jgi:hypothetical protein
MKKWANELNRAFSKEDVQWLQKKKKKMKKCLTSLAVKGMQIKITFLFHLFPVRMAAIKSINNSL